MNKLDVKNELNRLMRVKAGSIEESAKSLELFSKNLFEVKGVVQRAWDSSYELSNPMFHNRLEAILEDLTKLEMEIIKERKTWNEKKAKESEENSQSNESLDAVEESEVTKPAPLEIKEEV